jgi:hypothetical protein
MNRNRNRIINFFVNGQHDHWIGKEKDSKKPLNNKMKSQKNTKKKYIYKKKGVGGYA